MKSFNVSLRLLGTCFLCSAASVRAQQKVIETPVDVTITGKVAPEMVLIAEIYRAAALDDDVQADAKLLSSAVKLEKSSSVTIARRSATACAWLRNDGDRGRAAALAKRAVQQLAAMQESADADRADRLYWEAWLYGEYLDNKSHALRLVNRGAKLAPDDPRWASLRSIWAGTVAEKGN